MKVKLQEKDSVTVTNAYAPTYSVEDEKVEQFYDDIERAKDDSDSKYRIILQEILVQKLGLKQKKTCCWEHLELRGEMKDEIASLNLLRSIN